MSVIQWIGLFFWGFMGAGAGLALSILFQYGWAWYLSHVMYPGERVEVRQSDSVSAFGHVLVALAVSIGTMVYYYNSHN